MGFIRFLSVHNGSKYFPTDDSGRLWKETKKGPLVCRKNRHSRRWHRENGVSRHPRHPRGSHPPCRTEDPRGPLLDDFFLVLGYKADGDIQIVELSYDHPGVVELHESLERRLKIPPGLGLANRTDDASMVLWPPDLRGKPLFTPDGALTEKCLAQTAPREQPNQNPGAPDATDSGHGEDRSNPR